MSLIIIRNCWLGSPDAGSAIDDLARQRPDAAGFFRGARITVEEGIGPAGAFFMLLHVRLALTENV